MAASHAQASSSRPPSAAGTAASSTAASGSNGPAYHGLAHLDAYTEGELIGQGSFGVIHKVTRKSDGRQLARKQLNFSKMTQRDKQQLVAEVNILSTLQHPNIVGFIERILDQERGIIHIIMEYCGGGDLSHLIRECDQNNRSIPEETIWEYFYQIALALKHCHSGGGGGTGDEDECETSRPPSRGATPVGRRRESPKLRERVLHRDLKPDHVFLDDSRENVKLGDFGLSKALGAATFANTYVGTPYYMSPELFSESSYDSKSDIWALGCVIYEMVALHPPFHQAKTHNDLANQLRSRRIPPLSRRVHSDLRNVIMRMLEFDPKLRPSASEILSHPKMAEIHARREELVVKREQNKFRALIKQRSAQLAEREQAVLNREAAVREREEACSKQERHLERQVVAARREASAEREALRVERERWEEEKRAALTVASSSAALTQQQQQQQSQLPQQASRRPSMGAHSNGGEMSPTEMDGVLDIPGSGIKPFGSKVPRRSGLPKPLEEKNTFPNTNGARRESSFFDPNTPTKSTFSAASLATSSLRRAGTPSRLASKSMGNLAAAAREQRARDDSPGSDFMADMTMASVQMSARKSGLHQSTMVGQPRASSGLGSAPVPRRQSPTNPFGAAIERPQSRPALSTTSSSNSGFHMPPSVSSSSLAAAERGLFAGSRGCSREPPEPRWLEKENEDLPSPFLRKNQDVLGLPASVVAAASSRPGMPRSRSTAGLTSQAGPAVPSSGTTGNHLARMAMGNAMKAPVTGRSSRVSGIYGANGRRDSVVRYEGSQDAADRALTGH